MTGRRPGPHLARSAHQPGPGTPERPRPESAAPRPPLCPAPGAPGPGGAATRGHLAPAYQRFSVPQGRPPCPGRWRRGSGCNEALGSMQGKKPLPGPAMASRVAPPALPSAGKGPRATTCCAHGAAGPAPPRRSPAMCSVLPIDVFAKRKKNPHPNLFFPPPHVVVCFSFSSQTCALCSAPCSAKERQFTVSPRHPGEEKEEKRRRLRRTVSFPSLYIDTAESIFQSL